MFDRKNDVARNKKRADAIVYAGAADEVVLTQSDFESEEEFRRWKAWSDADYKQTEKEMRIGRASWRGRRVEVGGGRISK